MTEYQKYQLQWMIDHDKLLDDLIDEIGKHREDCDPSDDIKEVFWSWEHDVGFGGEIWACEAEWEDGDRNEKCCCY